MPAQLGLKILLVEDNDDIREGLAAVLEGEGYTVVPVATAEEGLTQLQNQAVHLLVSDYMLPGQTGAWLIEQARARQLLEKTAALMITAHPRITGAEGVQVIRKPLDIDDFLEVVYQMTSAARAAEAERARAAVQQTTAPAAANGARCALRLYVSSGSPSSLRALRNLHELLAGYEPAQVRVEIRDLSKDPIDGANDDKIAFTPTLVKRDPGPRAWVLGDLENARVVHDLLTLAGVEKRK